MENQQTAISPFVVVQLLFFIVFIPFLPLLVSWRRNWWEAWSYALICILGFAISRILASRRHPGYAGALMTYIVTPLFLDSLRAFLPADSLICEVSPAVLSSETFTCFLPLYPTALIVPC